jgi:hypothetical protein
MRSVSGTQLLDDKLDKVAAHELYRYYSYVDTTRSDETHWPLLGDAAIGRHRGQLRCALPDKWHRAV